ncbi:MAG: DUF1501 domain-containing protein, partial [Gemmataceae bacterium]
EVGRLQMSTGQNTPGGIPLAALWAEHLGPMNRLPDYPPWWAFPTDQIDTGIPMPVVPEAPRPTPAVLMGPVPAVPLRVALEASLKAFAGGARVVQVASHSTLFGGLSWDCHAAGGQLPTTLDDYRQTLAPELDEGLAWLIDRLVQTGRLASTLVLVAGEFGRTPHLNSQGGRDHWPGCQSILLFGGGVRGGQVVGRSDRHGAAPADRPVRWADIHHAVDQAIGLPVPKGDGLPELF